ncbi:AMP-binding enzyme [Penicillium sp. IBT 35674x]|nr:AMP-binding enzyme [Penicillium sp. IBT 35674x]
MPIRGQALRGLRFGRRLGGAPLFSRGLLTQSYARGPSQPPLIESTVGDHFAKVVAEHGDRTAVISKHQNDRITYASLDTQSNALARGLESVGINKGDRVGVMLGNSMEYAVITYALFKLGAILVPLNPSFNAVQIASALGHLESSHLIINTESNLPRKDPRSNIPLLQHLVEDLSSSKLSSSLVPSLKQIILLDNSAGRVDFSPYKSLTPFSTITSELSADGQPLTERNLDPNDIVNIQFTSGTTAMPKAACLTHRSILNNGYMATATHGSAIVFPTESFNARAVLKAVQEEKCTALYGVPTMFLEELGLIESGEISSDGFQYLRTGIAAGSSIPSELMKKLHRVLNLTELTICYGMTETSPVSAMTHTDDPIDKRLNTVGRLMPHVEAKVVHPANRNEILPIDTRGELAVSGYLLMKGYWGDPERTAKEMFADDNGKLWMHTGDEASMSPDGYITITGRIKDLIIRGGENIHPLEIENCLLAHPGVGEVSIVGVPDERYGEVVAAFVVAREPGSLTPEDIQQWVRGKLSSHLVPKYVFFLKASDASAKTASGKVQKFKLKEQAIKLLAERL